MAKKSQLLDVSFKRFFYDRQAVIDKLDKQRLASLRTAGGWSRTTARRRIRRRKGPSAAGESPHAHTSHPFATLKNIQFGFDTLREQAVVGAIGFGKADVPVPKALEEGTAVRRPNVRRSPRTIGKAGEIEARSLSGRRSLKSRRKEKARLEGDSSRKITGFDGAKWVVTFAILRSASQVRRANEIQEQLYGPLEIVGEIEARPYMEPAMKLAAVEFPDLYLKEG